VGVGAYFTGKATDDAGWLGWEKIRKKKGVKTPFLKNMGGSGVRY